MNMAIEVTNSRLLADMIELFSGVRNYHKKEEKRCRDGRGGGKEQAIVVIWVFT